MALYKLFLKNKIIYENGYKIFKIIKLVYHIKLYINFSIIWPYFLRNQINLTV